MLDRVREMLAHDPDPMVVSNCMSVIQKVRRRRALCASGRAAKLIVRRHTERAAWSLQAGGAHELLNKALLYSLVNRIKVCGFAPCGRPFAGSATSSHLAPAIGPHGAWCAGAVTPRRSGLGSSHCFTQA